MKKKFLLALPAVLLLTACPKTDNLYERNAYNKGFLQDYYTEFEGLDQFNLDTVDAGNVQINKHQGNVFSTKMAEKNDFYREGVLSKLYDGQTDCKEKYQLARVQLKNEGFGTRLAGPTNANQLHFSIRGGTNHNTPLRTSFDFNLYISLYTNNKIYRVDVTCADVPTDNDSTKLFDVSFNQIEGIVGYSIKFTCDSFRSNPNVNENDELALMLYEVVIE